MIELQVLNKIVTNNSLTLLTEIGAEEQDFESYGEEYNFITNHFKKYNQMPDDETILGKFPNFELLDVTEKDEFLVEEMREYITYNRTVPILNRAADKMSVDSYDAVNYLVSNLKDIAVTSSRVISQNININATERANWSEELLKSDDVIGISSGFDELDVITGGWLRGEDLIIVAGRPANGKTWLLLKYLGEAYKVGELPLLFTGEMGLEQVQYRLDSLITGLSLKGITRGKLSDDDLSRYKSELAHMEKRAEDYPFLVTTNEDIGYKDCTVSLIEALIQKYKPTIIGIDQLSFMIDERKKKGDTKRNEVFNITMDLFKLSKKYSIPIILAVQANRQGKNGIDGVPQLEDLAEGDGIGQNATRVITLSKPNKNDEDDLYYKIGLKKNRYGHDEIIYNYITEWDLGLYDYQQDLTQDIPTSTKRGEKLKVQNGKRSERRNKQYEESGEDQF